MRFFNKPFPALLVGVLLYHLDVVFAEVKLVEGEVHVEDYKETGDNKSRKVPHYEGPYREGSRQRGNSGETRDDKDRKDSSRGGPYGEDSKVTGDTKSPVIYAYEGPYSGGSRQRENSGETRDVKDRKDSHRGGPYGGIYDETLDGRNEDKVDKGDAHKGSYGTYGAYGRPVPTADLTLRSNPTLEPTQRPLSEQPSSYPSANEFDASESTFLGDNSFPKEHAPPDYVSPYAQYIPPTKEMPHVSKEDIPSYNQNIPHYVPHYTPPSDTPSAKHTSNTCCQCCSPPPPPPRKCQCCPPPPPRCYQDPGFIHPPALCCGPTFSYHTRGSYQQPHQGYDMRY
jgi:hypothetical protein